MHFLLILVNTLTHVNKWHFNLKCYQMFKMFLKEVLCLQHKNLQ